MRHHCANTTFNLHLAQLSRHKVQVQSMTSGPAGVMVCGGGGEVAQLHLGSVDPHHE